MTNRLLQRACFWLGGPTEFDSENPKMRGHELEELCERLGCRVVKVCEVDESVPGKTFREQLQIMLEDARDDKFDILVVSSLDQFAGGDDRAINRIIAAFQDRQVRFYSCAEPFLDIVGPFAGLLDPLLAWVAQQEIIRERKTVTLGTK